MTNIRSELSQFIRKVDCSNELSPAQLGAEIAAFLRARGVVADEATENAVEDFAEEANRGAGYRHPKPMGAAALADAIVDRFGLEER